jgi:hypothetical protein
MSTTYGAEEDHRQGCGTAQDHRTSQAGCERHTGTGHGHASASPGQDRVRPGSRRTSASA